MRYLLFSLLLLRVGLSHARGQFDVVRYAMPDENSRGEIFDIVDINEDGHWDVIYGTSFGVAFTLGNSTGAFEPLQYLSPFVSTTVYDGQGVDMDGDGDIDIVQLSLDTVSQRHLVIWWNGGNASFEEADTLDFQPAPLGEFRCMDIDGDVDQDLVVFDEFGYSMMVWNNGLGSFDFQPLNDLGVLFPESIADITGDTTPEWLFVTGAQGQSEVIARVLIEGEFFDIDTIDLGTASTSGRLTIGDLEGDGDLDIIAHGAGSSDAPSSLINFGDGSWSLPWELDLPGFEGWPPFGSMTVGDIDLDGDLDILSMGITNSFWYANLGGGVNFAQNPILTSAQQEAGMSSNLTWSTALADMDNDGDLDILGDRGSGLQVHLNDGAGSFPTIIDNTASMGSYSSVHTFADLDNDGYDDIILHLGSRSYTYWVHNLGDGSFSSPALVTQGPGVDYVPFVHDLNGDGKTDVLLHDGRSIFWSRNDLPGGFVSAIPIRSSDNPARLMSCIDLDGDTDLDIVSLNGSDELIYQSNDGSGNFSSDVVLSMVGGLANDIQIADVIGDELPDILYRDSWSVFVVHENLGNGTFAPAVLLNYLYDGGIVVDMDNDGDNDLLMPSCPDCSGDLPGISWLENLGLGQWSEARPIHRFEGFWVDELICADMDGDSDKDILFRQNEFNLTTRYIENMGGEVFAEPFIVVAEEYVVTGVASISAPNAPYDIVGLADGRAFWKENTFEGPFQVRGRVYFDSDQDGTYDPGEPPFPFASIVTDSPVLFTLTSANGGYEIGMLPATVQLNASVGSNELWVLNEGAAGYTVTTTEASPIASGLDFGFVPTGENSLFEVEIVRGIGPCGGQIPVWLHVKNTGTVSESGSIDLSVDEEMSILGDIPDGAVVSGNTLSLPFDGLGFMRTMVLPLTLGLPSAAFSGDVLSIAVTVSPAGAPASQVVNDTLSWVLTCSYDPNDKQVEPLGYGTFGSVRDTLNELEYTIRFQNVGTGPAFHVRIIDQLPAGLEWSGFAIKASSHVPSTVVINESGELEVGFLYIMLPDSSSDPTGSQGFIRFTIPLGADLPHLTAISNTASIFFDFNEPVITNTTITTLVDCDLWEPMVDNLLPDLLQATEGDLYQWFFNGEAITDATTRWLDVAQLGSYSAQVTSPYGCTAMSGEVQVISLGIAQHDRALLHAVPNPFNNSTIIRSSIPITPDHTITLCDAQGRVVLSGAGKGGDTFQIERGRLSQGLYLVRLHSANNGIESTLRVVIE
jgi:hypothetical protein